MWLLKKINEDVYWRKRLYKSSRSKYNAMSDEFNLKSILIIKKKYYRFYSWMHVELFDNLHFCTHVQMCAPDICGTRSVPHKMECTAASMQI